jgi:hypothetical protein
VGEEDPEVLVMITFSLISKLNMPNYGKHGEGGRGRVEKRGKGRTTTVKPPRHE